MKEKPKKIIYRTVVFRLFGVAILLVLAACTQPTDSGGANSLVGKGFVNISLGIADSPSPPVQKSVVRTDSTVPGANESPPEVLRTILPGSNSYSAFTSYKLIFSPSGGGDLVTHDNLTSLSGIVLDTGTYSLTFTAYAGSGDTKAEAATGTVDTVKVEEGKTVDVTVELSFTPPVGGGSGTLAVTVTNSSGLNLTEAKLAWTPLSGGTTTGSEPLSELSLNKSLDAGYYLITVTLSNKELKTVRSDIAHIGAGLPTTVAWTFVESNFSTIIDYIRLVGIPTWGTDAPNTVVATTENPDGTYTWEVEAAANATFRFILDDTSGYTDKWWARWFHPETNETDVSSVGSYQMKFTEGKPELAWKLSNAGSYALTVDPYAKTVTVAKPVIVESVAIKNANNELVTTISLAQDTTDYQFTAVVKGKNVESSQGVTWAISSGVATGTSIGQTDGKLTIDEAETVKSTFTITATSTSDTSKSASVTVTVTKKDAQPLPAPNVVLSDQGVATWTALTDETNVVKYLVHLYKGSDPVGTTQEVSKGGPYSVDFLTAMQSAVGSYTVKVKAVGDGENYSDSPEATSAAQSVSQKTKVVNVWWFETSKARWVNVDGDSNYTVQLYKGSSAVGSAVSVNRSSDVNPGNAAETVTTYAFSSTITTEGPGVYTFGVVTKGDSYLVLDAAETKLADASAYNYDVKLAAPTNPTWSGTGAQWDAVANANGYSVQLYKNGSASGAAVEVSSGTSYGSFGVSAAGSYTFKVKAIGTGTAGAGVYLDSDEADSSAKQVGGVASITLIPLEKQAGTLGVDGGGSASIVKGTGSLTINVTGSDFTTFVWIVDGVNQSETGSSITLSGGAYKLGGHSVTVYALDTGGVPWSPAAPITFTVTAN